VSTADELPICSRFALAELKDAAGAGLTLPQLQERLPFSRAFVLEHIGQLLREGRIFISCVERAGHPVLRIVGP